MHTPIRRRLASAATLAVAFGGLSVVSVGSAHAAVLDPSSMAAATVAGQFDIGECTANDSTYASEPVADLAADGVTRTATTTLSRTITRNGDPTDVTTLVGTTTRSLTINQAGGQLSSIAGRDTFSAQITAALGSAEQCGTKVALAGQGVVLFTLVKPSYVTVKTVSRGMGAQVIFVGDGGMPPFGSEFLGTFSGGKHGTSISTAVFPAGDYMGQLMSSGAGVVNRNVTGEVTFEITFDDPGIAKSETAGKGKKFVTLPDAYNCMDSTAVVTWKNKAGKGKKAKIKKAVFRVDGAKMGKAKGKKATKGKTTTLKGLPADKAFTLEGTITLKSGKELTVRRDYQACD